MERCEVVVVGAGLAGLTSALRLAEASRAVIVLEATDTVGGRVLPASSAGQTLDAGGTFIAAQHERIRALASQLQVDLVRTRLERAPARWRMEHLDRQGFVPPGLATLLRVGWGLSRLERRLPPAHPWNAAVAGRLDARSVASFLDQHGATDGSDAGWLRAQLRGLATVDLHQLSLLHLAWWLARPGGVVPALRDTRALVGAQGTHQLAERLRQELGDVVRLRAPVSEVHALDRNGPVRVTSGGEQFQASAAVVAVPLPTLGHIDFEPHLDADHQRAIGEVRFGAASKIVARASARPGRWRTVFGGRHLQTAWRIGPALAGVAPHVNQQPPSEEDLADDLAAAFDLAPAALVDPQVVDWTSQPNVRGTYIAYAPGQLTRYGPALAHGETPVWFAAAERSSWPDSMEGAVESGERAARLVAGHLDRLAA